MKKTQLEDLDSRAREIFREIVETYLETGEPVGSRTLSLKGIGLSPATIRNTMSDLASLGLLNAPHISSGREPTHHGIRLFVDGILEISEISNVDKEVIDSRLQSAGDDFSKALSEATNMVSAIAGGAGLVTTPQLEDAVSQVEFIGLTQEKILVIIVFVNGHIENRVINVVGNYTASQLQASSNFINHHFSGKTITEAQSQILHEISKAENEIDLVTSRLIQDGLAQWSGASISDERKLIVRGRANLLKDTNYSTDLERVRELLDELEKKRDLIDMLNATENETAVKLFIGSENPLFALSGSALIAAPYLDGQNRVIGALGVIGPTRINYGRIIPIVDYTAQMLTKMIKNRGLITPKG